MVSAGGIVEPFLSVAFYRFAEIAPCFGVRISMLTKNDYCCNKLKNV
jgi:hypothetical protein